MPKRQKQAVIPHKPDAFFEAVSLARMRGYLVPATTLNAGEQVSFPATAACFHYLEGQPCMLYIAGSRRKIDLIDGDLIFLPRGEAHRIEREGRESAATHVTTGVFRVESAYADAIVRALPQCLHVSQLGRPVLAPERPEQWLAATLAAMRAETDRPTLGSALMLSRLIDLLFVWAIRHWLTSAPAQAGGWIAALRDPVIGEALALVHTEPARNWDVDTLARHVNQSRSGFSQRFVDLVGEPPIRYLTRWRMYMAADLLASTRLRVSQIAGRVGYDSEPAFSRAFKRHLGVAPVEYRAMPHRRS